MMRRIHYLWAVPWAIIKSMPYFFQDIWGAFDHLYSNVTCGLVFLLPHEEN